MLFILNGQGVPSVAKFVQLSATPSNVPPDGTITLPAGNVTIQAGQSVSFAGSGSDPDGAVSRYAWTFPGGTPFSVLNNPTPGAVTFTQPGTYAVALTVVDSAGENDPSPPTRTITVTAATTNQPPIANPGGPYAGGVGQAVAMNGSGSSDPDGSIASYAWNFGDNTTGTGVTPSHTYANAGGYTVTLTVTDNTGATGSATTSATVSATVSTPAAPSNLVLTRLARPKVTLQWTDNASNESGFKLERSGDGRTFTQIATLGPNVTTYTDSGVNRTTYYRVRAYNSAGNSAYSNTLRVF
jgi:PKD repeat protein